MEKIDNAQGSALDSTPYQSAIGNYNIKSACSWSWKHWQVKRDGPGDSTLPRVLFLVLFFFFFFNQGVIGRTRGECVEPQEKIAWYSAFNFYQRTWTHILRSSLDDN